MKITSKFLSKVQMQALNTRRLLAYRNKLLSYPDSPNLDEKTISKVDPDWQETYQILKDILATREHLEKGV